MATGIFTSPTSGVFSLSLFFSADNNEGSTEESSIESNLYLQKNGNSLDEGRMYSSVFSAKSGKDDDSSGRTLLIGLDKGDNVSVYMVNGNIYFVSFCVHSIV